MLKAYFNGTKKKFVATTLALTITFSAVVIPPISHSYDSAILQANAIETEDELQNLRDEQRNLMEDELKNLRDKRWNLIYELQEIKQIEVAGVSEAKRQVEVALSKFKEDIDSAYEIESINDIYLAIRSLERGPMWTIEGEDSLIRDSIYKTFVDMFTDNAKDLLDEIFDSAFELEEDAFDKSKEIIEAVINSLCDNIERIADLTAEKIDPQNRKAEIENRIKEIESRIKEIENRIKEIELQILNKIGSQKEEADTSKSLVEILANKFHEAYNKQNTVKDEYNAARDKWYKLTSEYEEAIKPAKTKWEATLKDYENAAKKYQAITLNLSDDEYKTIFDTLIDATNKDDEARSEYFNAKTVADNKYSADIAAAKSEYTKLEADYSEVNLIYVEIQKCLDMGIIDTKELTDALIALGYKIS